MSLTRIASRYAKSLLDLAIEEKKLEAIMADIKSFQSAIENRDLYLLLKSPIIKPAKKLSIADAIFKGKIDDLTFSFIKIVIKKGREQYLPEIAQEFIKQYKVFKNITTVKLTTAYKLPDTELNKIKSKLMESNLTDENIELKTVVEPEIIGGFVISIEDKLYDDSVQHKLDELKKELSSGQLVKAI